MKFLPLYLAFSILFCGCARKSELEQARANLAAAQQKIEALETERVSRTQYDTTRASLKIADEHIATLERGLKAAQELLLAAQEREKPAAPSTSKPETNEPAKPVEWGLVKGAYESSNETYVYSPDAQLNFGRHLQISSPTGLLVTDPEQKIVGGDLAIRAKDVTLETSDGLLTTAEDGTVKFTGKTLTMKFDDKKSMPDESTAAPPPPNENTSEDAPKPNY